MNFEITAAFYHGDMDLAHRETVHVKWKSNDIKIIVATSAFGMGIDKSDVRFIVHYQMPQTIDSYI
jgi:superfamily II DNA helicase RecQ